MAEVQRRAVALDTSPYVEMGETYLAFQEDTPFDVWRAVTSQLIKAEKSIRWWIGDALRFGESHYGEKYTQAIEATGYSYGTLRNSVYVAERYDDLSLRNDNVSFSFHEIAAPLEPEERIEVLEHADEQDWTAKQLREEVKERRTMPANPSRAQVVKAIPCPHCNGTGEIIEEV